MTLSSTETIILGISPEDDRVRLWMWSQAASLQILGTYTPKSASAMAARLMRNRPDLQIFIAAGVAL